MTSETDSIFQQVPEIISQNIIKLVDDRISSEVPRVVQSLSQPPQWFVDGINSVKNEVKSVKDELKEEIRILERAVNELTISTNTGFRMIHYKLALLDNVTRRNNGYTVAPVPFINLEITQDGLPPIETVQDIDSLSKEDCQKYLDGYNIPYRPNERALLKSKLRDSVGLVSSGDLRYTFSNFTEEL
ncbi:unnamed protein product [Debaryomyces tyrocola]|nr:unnamed protein product [Debaryomyces tyrocola]